MTNLHQAILSLNPTIVTIRGNVAYDKNEQVIQYDLTAAQAKLVELQNAETDAEKVVATNKAFAVSKLMALGLTSDEINALLG
jgi:phage terminase Nu1 subunit (DNA packaging protein)